MHKIITLREGFRFIIEEKSNKVNIKAFLYKESLIAEDWMEVTDFVAVLESGIRNKLGIKKKYQLKNNLLIYGTINNEDGFKVNLKFNDNLIIDFDIVETQQLVSKLNKNSTWLTNCTIFQWTTFELK